MLRQCQQEQRIATQLMQVRAEKENIRNNRIEQQRQFEERRRKDFEEYLSRQAVRPCVHVLFTVTYVLSLHTYVRMYIFRLCVSIV